MYFLLQKFLVVLACVLAAASAKYYVPSVYGQSGYGLPKAVPLWKASIFSDEFRSIVTKLVDATNKAAEALNAMAPQLPAVLGNLDPGIKADVAKVSAIIGNVCDNILLEARPTGGFQYYTPDTLKKTCDYIWEISSDVVNGLDNPAIYQNYVDEMNGAIAKLNSFAAWL